MSMQTIESGGLEILNGSITVVGGTISGTFVGDGGNIIGTVLSSSYASTASFVSGAYTSRWALSSSAATSITFVPTSASYATSASAAGQFFAAGITGSYTGTLTGSATTASYATIAQNVLGSITSASYALTASYAPGGSAFDSTVARGYSGSFTGSVTGSFVGIIPNDTSINGMTIGLGPDNNATNLAFGAGALQLTSGNYNLGIGLGALQNTQFGVRNVAIGYNSMQGSNTQDTVAIGYDAASTAGAYTVAIGSQAHGYDNGNSAGSVAVGAGAMLWRRDAYNIGIGFNTMIWAQTGQYNIAIGVQTANTVASGANLVTQGSASIYIGSNIQPLTSGSSNEIIIGDSGIGRGSNTIVLGNTASLSVYLYGSVSASSFSGSFIGTSSYATSASWSPGGAFDATVSRGYTGSFTGSSTGTLQGNASSATTASFVSGAYTAQWAPTSSFATTASFALNSAGSVTSAQTASVAFSVSGSGTGSFIGSFTGSVTNAVSSSFVSGAYTSQWAKVSDTASFVSGAYTSQWALSSSAATSITFIPTSASYATSASAAGQFFVGGITGSHTGTLTGSATTAVTASFVSGAYTAQWAKTTDTSSFVSGAYTAQWSLSSSWAPGGAFDATVSRGYTGSFTGSVTGALQGTSSWANSASTAISASYAPGGSAFDATVVRNYSGTFSGSANNATSFFGTASYALAAPGGTSFDPSVSRAYTGSLTGSVTGNLQGSASYAPTAWDDILNIPTGLVSGAAQINTGSFTGSFTGSTTTAITASFVSGAYTAQWALSSSWAPGGAFDATIVRGYSGTFSGSANAGVSFIGTASMALTQSQLQTVTSASWASASLTSSYASGAIAFTVTGAVALSASYFDMSGIPLPAPPPADTLRVYARKIGGRMLMKWTGPSGIDTFAQPALFGTNTMVYFPTAGTTATGGWGTLWAKGGSAGVVSTPPPSASGNPDRQMLDQMRRTRHTNVVTTTNQACGIIATAASQSSFWRGNAAGLGGFFFNTRFGIGTLPLLPTSSFRLFAGLTPGTAEVVISDIVPANSVGFWHDATDTNTQAFFITKDATTISSQSITGVRFATGSVFDVFIFCKPNDNTIYWRVDDVSASVTLADTGTLQNLPVNTVFMGPQVEISNGTASLAVATVAIDVNRIYIESDH